MEAFAIPFLLFVGALLAVQAGANVQLSAALGSPLGASAVQLTIGAALLVALAALAGGLGAAALLDDVDAWHLAGGLGSAIYITAGILLFPRLGAVVTVGLFVTGQMLASLVLDGTGWLGVEQEAIGAVAIAAAAAVLAGVAAIVRGQGSAPVGRARWVALALLAGAALPVQGAVNARLRADLDEPITVGAWSFVVAALAMVAVLALDRSRPHLAPARPRAVVGLARRPVRRDLRDVRVPADPGDRRGANHRADRRRPAGRLGVRRPPRPAAPAAPADHADPVARRGDAARGRGAHAGRVRTSASPGKRDSRSSRRSEISRAVPAARVRVTPASRSSRRW